MGLTPSEKQRYNESKRRRRQAMESYATGKIKPMRSRRRLAWLIVAAVLLIAMPLMSLDAGNSGDEDKFQIPQGRFVMDYYHSIIPNIHIPL